MGMLKRVVIAFTILDFIRTIIGELKAYLTRTVLTTTPDTTIMEVLSSMLEMKVNRLPVIEKGVVVGIISRGDIIFALYKKKA